MVYLFIKTLIVLKNDKTRYCPAFIVLNRL
jgi:hypothetical protein